MRTELTFIPLAYTLVYSAHAVYVGCFDHIPVLAAAVGEYLYFFEVNPPVACDCRGIGYDYSYTYENFFDVGQPFAQSCYCTDSPPDFRYYYDQCQGGIENIPDVRVNLVSALGDGWSYGSCYKPSTAINGISVSTLPQCLSYCNAQGTPYAAVIHRRGDSSASCGCYATQSVWQGLPNADCLYDDWIIYSHTPQPSSLARKRGNRYQTQQREHLCPIGTTACKMGESRDVGFECIDTSSELESCGGCVFGEVSPSSDDKTSAFGVNCILQPGVSLNGVACSEGHCIALRCEEGYTLVDDQCIGERI